MCFLVQNMRPIIPSDCPVALRALIEQCWSSLPEKRPEFSEIVKVLEQFESTVARDGKLNHFKSLTCHDQKERLLGWMPKKEAKSLK
ncbi:Serine/threonine-protein kinase HT1 [Apostasia shenzhenica]|uniref:Serine/threonine-protein kinase HT1 n=1 Tax=Apostasia shenzhenica TaxID=1088818 RepID=A0A2I0AKF3_9ASPA|nr:Serine/threonine-protein kinase HT1 [Apostasia shenzhenica]